MVAKCPVRPKKQAIIFLEVHHEWTTFTGFGSSGSIQAVDCRLVSFAWAFFWASVKLCGIHQEQIFLRTKYSCKIKWILICDMLNVFFFLTICDMPVCMLLMHSIYAARNYYWFWSAFMRFITDGCTTTMKFCKPIVNSFFWWCFIAISFMLWY